MENPATWGKLEHVIDNALNEIEVAKRSRIVGLSDVRIIADALRAAGMVNERGNKDDD